MKYLIDAEEIIDVDEWIEGKKDTTSSTIAVDSFEDVGDEEQPLPVTGIVKPKGKAAELEDETHDLEEDIYSLMFVSGFGSPSFLFASFIFLFQIWILILIIINQLETDDIFAQGNHLRAPVIPSSLSVTLAKYSAIVIALVSQDDAISSLELLSVVYDPSVLERFPQATRSKWILSNVLRFAEGVLTVTVSLIFIVQADDVLGMFMDFAAVEFVSELDNLFFGFGAQGYMSKDIALDTEAVAEIKFGYHPNQTKRQWMRFAQRLVLLLILVGLYVALAVTYYKQNNGEYIFDSSCTHLQVSFSGKETFEMSNPLQLNLTSRNTDLFVPQVKGDTPPSLIYSYFSGEYIVPDKSEDGLVNSRPVYYERGLSAGEPTAAMFYYCENDQAWVFTIPAMVKNIPNSSILDCGEYGWLMQSPVTEATSLDKAPTEGWSVWTGAIVKADIDVSCNQCARNADCGMENGNCSKATRMCECRSGWTGHHCEVEDPLCPQIEWVNYGTSSKEFVTDPGKFLKDDRIKSGNRPVYLDNTTYESIDNLVLYVGTHWLDTYWNRTRLEALMSGSEENSLHSYWHLDRSRNIKYFTQDTDQYTPVQLSMSELRNSRSVGAQEPYGASRLLSSNYECVNFVNKEQVSPNYCGSNGDWNSMSGSCDCRGAYGGYFCEFEPTGPYAQVQAAEYVLNVSETSSPNEYFSRYWAKYNTTYLMCTLLEPLQSAHTAYEEKYKEQNCSMHNFKDEL